MAGHPRTIRERQSDQQTQNGMETIPADAALSTVVDLAVVATA